MSENATRSTFDYSHEKLVVNMEKFYRNREEKRDNDKIKFEKLLAWAQKVSKKTGIPLEYL